MARQKMVSSTRFLAMSSPVIRQEPIYTHSTRHVFVQSNLRIIRNAESTLKDGRSDRVRTPTTQGLYFHQRPWYRIQTCADAIGLRPEGQL